MKSRIMKKRKTVIDHELLLLTDIGKYEDVQWFVHRLEEGDQFPAIAVVPLNKFSRRHFLILDGNKRAVAHAYLNRPIRFFEISSELQIDAFLEVESRAGVAGFPHRKFLTGEKSMKELVLHAALAYQERGMRTALDLAQEFRAIAKERKVTSPQ